MTDLGGLAGKSLMIRYAARSDVGLVRDGNEDSGYAGPRLLAVADGMGGHAAGELASSTAIDELIRVETAQAPNGGDRPDPLDSLDGAVHAAHARIRELVKDDPGREGMGTTVTALLWTGSDFGLAHIGDSRGYRLRAGELEQITHDHTFVQSLVDEGRITADQASVHPARSMILRALQGDTDPQPDLEMIDVQPGDRLLLCSDGLTDVISTDTIRDTLVGKPSLTDVADTLVDLALRGGAPDNVTLVVADVVETDAPPAPDDTAEAYLVGAVSGDEPSTTLDDGGAAMRGLVSRDALDAAPGAARNGQEDLEELRYAPQPPKRFRWLRRLAAVALAAVILWAGGSLTSDWIRSQYYVGDQAGEVAIFRGVSQEIGPISLSRLHSTADDLPVGALPEVIRNRVGETIPADNLSDAERLVEDLRAQACASLERAAAIAAAEEEAAAADESAGAADTDAEPGAEDDEPDALPTAPPGYPGLSCPEDS
jgi:serine/threonine protein phosphatase PrpC